MKGKTLILGLSLIVGLVLWNGYPDGTSDLSAQTIEQAESGMLNSSDEWDLADLLGDDDSTEVDQQGNKGKKKKKSKVEEILITEVFYYSLGIDLLAVMLLILLVYYPGNRKPEQVFTFILFNVTIFMLTFVLNQVKISMGAAFGLFAVFSMLRYRTRSITMKDMTYLFVFIALGLINAVQLRYDVMVILNLILILIIWLLDSNLIIRYEYSKTIQYDKIDLIRPEMREQLMADLRQRTGLNVTRFEIRRVNFLRDTVRLTIYYRESPGGIYSRMNGTSKNSDE